MLGAGLVWRRAPLAVGALLIASTAIYAVATVTYPRIGKDDTGPWTWWQYVRASSFIDTLAIEFGGPHGWLSVAPFFLALCAVLAVGIRAARPRLSRSQIAIAVAAIVGWALLLTAALVKAKSGG
jgi:drug/metabolite transporter (DMT)-like permease